MNEDTVRKAIGYGAAIILILMIAIEFLTELSIPRTRLWILFLLVAGFLDFVRRDLRKNLK